MRNQLAESSPFKLLLALATQHFQSGKYYQNTDKVHAQVLQHLKLPSADLDDLLRLQTPILCIIMSTGLLDRCVHEISIRSAEYGDARSWQGSRQKHAWGWVGRRLWRPAMALKASLLCTMGMVSSASSSSGSCNRKQQVLSYQHAM